MASVRVVAVSFVLLALAMAVSGEIAPAGPKFPAHAEKFVNKILANPNLKILAGALKATGLVDPLKGLAAQGVTAFGPTDKAFLSLPKQVVTCLGKEPGLSKVLKPILFYHVSKGKYTASKLRSRKSLTSVLGPRIAVSKFKKTVKVDNAVVIKGDAITSSTSVAHVIDAVLIPKALLPVIKKVCF
ncbi:hypothetical protein CBR_g63124 [Chara braunii]|uniref:FAS1 domain-containing protein n=1 Tax=Chara braunii TaxID=69332 RepID=A0A388K903_CHABU|nr:hypothetical protein CBR_g63124 [Chara braunii]|eukprot:GBG66542.1 hypothetical protein CBR_g63124 [Chara braunii]